MAATSPLGSSHPLYRLLTVADLLEAQRQVRAYLDTTEPAEYGVLPDAIEIVDIVIDAFVSRPAV